MFLSPPLTLYSCLPSGRGRQVIILDTFIQRNEKSVKGVDKDNQKNYMKKQAREGGIPWVPFYHLAAYPCLFNQLHNWLEKVCIEP